MWEEFDNQMKRIEPDHVSIRSMDNKDRHNELSFNVLETNKELDGEVSEEIYEILEDQNDVEEESVYSGPTNEYTVS